jgi:hypothetical protein
MCIECCTAFASFAIFELSCATGSRARRAPRHANININEAAGMVTVQIPRSKHHAKVLEESEAKRQKPITGEGIAALVDEMRMNREAKKEDHKKRLDILNRPDIAMQLFLVEYTDLDDDAFNKIMEHLNHPENASIFLALKDRKEKRIKWLETSVGIWIIEIMQCRSDCVF